MTITIELTDAQEAILRERAARAGQTVEEYAHDLIVRALDELEARGAAERAGDGPARRVATP